MRTNMKNDRKITSKIEKVIYYLLNQSLLIERIDPVITWNLFML